ncbi:MAG: QacE family quaternary ammonium compound efflux SMR transporter [Comamonas sp.]|jgi:small multidrug resistance pump|nr:QacE family quaternary ammonium compound efflux SMR transporter [Comamonas sp.]HRL38212.1 SMR family transporter [Comamonas denitrificans]MBP7855064.1 QacE family quaternary ammonium compound efflux SMR transporter [Comamonas sp.]MBP7871843.1 QacE family quaternary ammonium compound efflux SMR transporter [Comamonas sp.]HRL90825.1 SMR family transporter [Comamonas denitrificans]
MASAVTAAYTYLGIAIVAEVVATSALKASEGFTRPMPSLITAVGYALAFYCLSHTLKSIPTGVAYALWSGVGIVLISAVGWLWLGQRLDAPALLGLGLIIAGVVVINVFSKSITH